MNVPTNSTSGMMYDYSDMMDSDYDMSNRLIPGSDTSTVNGTTVTNNCKLILYDQTYFRGQSKEITGDMSDFNDISFDNALASLKIEGNCCWTILTDANYRGNYVQLTGPGEYKSPNQFKKIFKKASSARSKCY